jgi:hypothetical protein
MPNGRLDRKSSGQKVERRWWEGEEAENRVRVVGEIFVQDYLFVPSEPLDSRVVDEEFHLVDCRRIEFA